MAILLIAASILVKAGLLCFYLAPEPGESDEEGDEIVPQKQLRPIRANNPVIAEANRPLKEINALKSDGSKSQYESETRNRILDSYQTQQSQGQEDEQLELAEIIPNLQEEGDIRLATEVAPEGGVAPHPLDELERQRP